jgi:cell wall-associated NlpC family hydrolase
MSLRLAGVIGGGLIVILAVVAGAGAAAVAALGSQLDTALVSSDATPSHSALTGIPVVYLQTYQAAAATCPGLAWTVLAGIGQAETDQGRDDQVSTAGAEGPMQFEPATFSAYDHPVPPGGVTPPTPYDPVDAIYAAARDLCANGARNGVDIAAAIYAYNHDNRYVARVLAYAATFAAPAAIDPAPDPAATPTAARAVSYALAQLGTPYRWGGEAPGVGFDCSGLTQAAYNAAGLAIPRTSEAQWTGLPHVPLDDLEPGDLVFFDPGEFLTGLPGHVGIYIGDHEMVDAPHTGAAVRTDNLADWPTPVGAARPAATIGAAGP